VSQSPSEALLNEKKEARYADAAIQWRGMPSEKHLAPARCNNLNLETPENLCTFFTSIIYSLQKIKCSLRAMLKSMVAGFVTLGCGGGGIKVNY